MSIIIVVLPKIEDAKKICKILMQHGYDHTVACATAAAALSEMDKYSAGLVISGYKLSDMYYTQLQENLPRFYDMLLIGSASVVSSVQSGIVAVTTPIRIYDLINTVEMQMRQIDRRIKKDKKRPKERSEKEENYIRNAKFILMERNHLTEEDAYRYIQKCSMDNGTGMVETAQMILALVFDEE